MSERAPVSRLVLVVVGGAVLLGLVVVLYDRGWLPIAGPFAAVALAGVVVYAALWFRQRRLVGLRDRTRTLLEGLRDELSAERSRPLVQRGSGADDRSLANGAAQVDAALPLVGWAHEAGPASSVAGLVRTASDWRPGSELRRRVEELAVVVARAERTQERLERVAASRRTGTR